LWPVDWQKGAFSGGLAALDFLDCPVGVFADQGVGVVGGGIECGQVVGGTDIAEGDADIAQEARAFAAFDGRFAEEFAELLVIEGEEIAQGVFEDALARVKAGFFGGLGEAVPRADMQAFVAAIDPVADGFAEFQRDGTLVFDGEIGNTAAGIEAMRRGDGVGRAGIHAAGAGSTVVDPPAVGFEFEGGEQFAEEKPCAESAVDLDCRFAIPADSGFMGEVAFEYRPGIDVIALSATPFFQCRIEGLEFFDDEVVVVIVPCVAGDAAGGPRVVRFGLVLARVVVEREDDDRSDAGEDFARVDTAVGIARHPLHVAVFAVVDPLQIGFGVRCAGCFGDPAIVESELGGKRGDAGFEAWVGLLHGGRCFRHLSRLALSTVGFVGRRNSRRSQGCPG